ncbi:hypothetical protein TrST_g2645 [Triparma strigata]|uniref:Uncharacterized protein n=1 Tax=Triparma strigata TaxID=1606541 RepID=A0A9W7BNZ3_9STRA|nr:hypothetical protein TrST_g2645 [Triparma strigata]
MDVKNDDDIGSITGDDDYVLLDILSPEYDPPDQKKELQKEWIEIEGYPVTDLYEYDCNGDGQGDVVSGWIYEDESVTFNEIQCWSLEEGVVWSNQLEIKGFGGRWDFGIEIIGGKGYVMTSLCKMVRVDLKNGEMSPVFVYEGTGVGECSGSLISGEYFVNGKGLGKWSLGGGRGGEKEVRGRPEGAAVGVGGRRVMFWRTEEAEDDDDENVALLYMLDSKTLEIIPGYPLKFTCISGHVSQPITVTKPRTETGEKGLRGVKVGGGYGVKVAFTVDSLLIILDTETFEISETNLGFTSTTIPYTRTHESGTLIGVAGAESVAEYRIEEVGGGRWEKGRRGGRRDANEGEVTVEDMEVKGGWVRVAYETNGNMGDRLSGVVEIWDASKTNGGVVFAKQRITGEATFWGGAIPRTMELTLRIKKSTGGHTSQNFLVHYNEHVLEGLEWLVLLPMLMVGVAVGGYDDEKRKKREFREEIYGDGRGKGLSLG